MTYYEFPGEPKAKSVHHMVHISFEVFQDVMKARAKNPEAYPLVPKNNVAEWFATRMLASLVDAGFKPDKWEQEFIAEGPFKRKEKNR